MVPGTMARGGALGVVAWAWCGGVAAAKQRTPSARLRYRHLVL